MGEDKCRYLITTRRTGRNALILLNRSRCKLLTHWHQQLLLLVPRFTRNLSPPPLPCNSPPPAYASPLSTIPYPYLAALRLPLTLPLTRRSKGYQYSNSRRMVASASGAMAQSLGASLPRKM